MIDIDHYASRIEAKFGIEEQKRYTEGGETFVYFEMGVPFDEFQQYVERTLAPEVGPDHSLMANQRIGQDGLKAWVFVVANE